MNDRLPQLQKQIIDFGNSAEFKELDAYYSQPSIFNALGVSRHENTHSNFIAWLLDPSSNHGLGDMPLRKFLEAFSLACALPHSRGKIPQDLISAITAGDYKLSAVTVEREKVLKDGSRVDIYLEGIIAFDRKEYPLKLAIENKVKSSEHDSQTKRYLEALRPPVSSPDIFLTPLSNRKYELLGAPECDSKDFIQLNYQYLADYIIEPCRDCLEEGGVKRYLTEYLLALGLPETRQTKGDFIMAISKEERALLARFWDKHKDLLTAVILSINEYVPLDDEESEVVAKAAKALEAAAQRNLTRYSWEHYTGGTQSLPKSRLVLEVVTHYAQTHMPITLEELQQVFPKGLIPSFETVEALDKADASNFKGHKRYYTDEPIQLSDKPAAVCNQWRADSIERFIALAEKLGYIIVSTE